MTADIRIADLFPSRWLKAKDLTDAGANLITDTVTRVTLVDVQPQPGEHVDRLALHLAGHKPYLVTSKADATTLAEAYRIETASQLVGRPIAIKLDVWRRQAVLRIAPPPPAAPKPAAAKPKPAATTAQPVTTAATAPAAAGGGGAQAAPPVAPPVTQPPAPAAPTNGRHADAVQLWPPREPWVSRKKSTGDVDWVTTWWQMCAALRIAREDGRTILERAGGSFEDAALELWERQPGATSTDEDAIPAF